MSEDHDYHLKVIWTGNKGVGTKEYHSYDRSLSVIAEGKPDMLCSSDPIFRGDPKKWNPEELLLASISSCHMLSYLHLCVNHHITVTEYIDEASAIMKLEASGSGFFATATLQPRITILESQHLKLAEELHKKAHKICFIANSVNFPIQINPTIVLSSKS